MELIAVNRTTCIQDGLCAQACLADIIDFDEGSYPVADPKLESRCITCGHCVAICPTASLSHRDINVADCPPIRDDLMISPEQCEQLIKSRRSMRKYKNKKIPREIIGRLIETASYAPTGMNNQCTEWLVVDDPEKLRQISSRLVDWMRLEVGNNSERSSWLDFKRHIKNWENGIDHDLRGAPALIVTHAAKDARMAGQTCRNSLLYFELAAFGFGLGCCQTGFFNMASSIYPPLIEILGLPENHGTFGALVCGYPELIYHRIPTRKRKKITYL